MALNAATTPPVLELIKTVLVTVQEDPFNGTSKLCLGTSGKTKKNSGRQCQRAATSEVGREVVQRLRESFSRQTEVPHDEIFYATVEIFLFYVHCHEHRDVAIENFRSWKRSRLPLVPPPLVASAVNAMSSTATQDVKDRRFVTSAKVAPEQVSGDEADTSELSMISDHRSDTAISPGAESDQVFEVSSPASTAVTTPGLDEEASKIADGGEESRPSTPTRASRNPARPVMNRPSPRAILAASATEPYRPERDDVLAQYEPDDTAGRDEVRRRFGSVKKHKWPLLKVIESQSKSLGRKEGRVYVWKSTVDDGIIKIGFTRTSSHERHSHKSNCYAKTTEPFWESKDRFIGAYRVEQIVLKELADQNMPHVRCLACGRKHLEWFAMNAEQAIKALEGWTEFVKIAYENGALTTEGRQLLNMMVKVDPAKLAIQIKESRGLAAVEIIQTQLEGLPIEENERNLEGSLEGRNEERDNSRSDNKLAVSDQPTSWPASTIPDEVSQPTNASATEPETSRSSNKGATLGPRRIFKAATFDLKNRMFSRPSEPLERSNTDGNGRVDRRHTSTLLAKLVGRFYSKELGGADENSHQSRAGLSGVKENSRLMFRTRPSLGSPPRWSLRSSNKGK